MYTQENLFLMCYPPPSFVPNSRRSQIRKTYVYEGMDDVKEPKTGQMRQVSIPIVPAGLEGGILPNYPRLLRASKGHRGSYKGAKNACLWLIRVSEGCVRAHGQGYADPWRDPYVDPCFGDQNAYHQIQPMRVP